MNFLGENLTLARDFWQFTRAELAERAEVSVNFLGVIERNAKPPGPVLVAALGEVLGVSPSFFFEPIPDRFTDEQCAFRRRVATSISLRRRALAHGTLLGQLVDHLDGQLELPIHNVPSLPSGDVAVIERAAETCRMQWGLGRDTPIPNMVRVLEHAGVVVGSMSTGDSAIDAFSRPGLVRDVVIMNDDKDCSSRARFDCAHELGHLVLHRGQPTGTEETETQADLFASEFLMPKAGIIREFPRSPQIEWEALFKMKQRWRVSVQALVRRAYSLGIFSAVAYRRAYKYISWQGWRRKEPGEFQREQPELLAVAMRKLAEIGTTASHVARRLGWELETLTRVARIDFAPAMATPGGVVVSFRPRTIAAG